MGLGPLPGLLFSSQSLPVLSAHRAVAKLPHFKNLEMNGNQLVERAVEDVRSLLEERNMVLGGGCGCVTLGRHLRLFLDMEDNDDDGDDGDDEQDEDQSVDDLASDLAAVL